ncbi:S8 family serine peptidase [Streptosporangium canum]|uniref:S8 family serine peptidase n=1 Tax=Streptosporangium canum TaxID=324952 RepID=UPI0036CFBC49
MTLRNALMAALLAGAAAATPTPSSAAPTVTGTSSSVTLITGDRVMVAGNGFRVVPGPGRQVDFTSQMRQGHLYVIPSDARALVAGGMLDRRLFDVTQLLAWRYDDARRSDIPLIAQSAQMPAAARQARRLAGAGMTTLRVPKASAGQAWKDLTSGARALGTARTKLWLDGRRSFDLDQSVKQIGATTAWELGLTGKGVTVAVLDSGYDPDHPDLKGAVAYERNFSEDPDIRDTLGHGTHVASTVAGAGQKYRGVAPDAKLAIGKVGGVDGIADSAVLAGMEWAALEVKAKIVNMSLGGPDTLELDPLEEAVNSLSERTGTLFVISAGNNGRPGIISSPGSADAALTVGAVDRSDRIADFSSRGPRQGDHAIKPDLTAPGVDIVAAAPGGAYQTLSGTSMAAPHVTGAATILAQKHPEWTGRQLKAALIGSAAPSAGATLYQQGTGRADVARAVDQQIVALPGDLWATFPWNGPGERVVTRTLTYANTADTPATVDLAAEGETLKLSTQRLEVPAKGEASLTLTIDARQKAPGDYPGVVTARSGQSVIRTPAGAYVEPESYNLTVSVIGRDGNPAHPYVELYDPKTGAVHELAVQDGIGKARLPVGEWNLYADFSERAYGRTVAHTAVRIADRDQQVVVDARKGNPVRVTLDDPSAAPGRGHGLNLSHGAWGIASWSSVDPNTRLFIVPARQEGLRYLLRTIWSSKDAVPTPYLYDLADHRTGGLPEDPTYAARQKDLATVSATFRASATAATGLPLSGPRFRDDWPVSLASPPQDLDLPGTLTYYRTPGLTWDSLLELGAYTLADDGQAMKPGQHTRQTWNAAVTGPATAGIRGSRTGDTLTFSTVGLFTDPAPGRVGADAAATGTATLSRNGHVLTEAPLADCALDQWESCRLQAALPAESSVYTLRASMRRQVPYSALSTAVESVWTFRSARTETERPLPLMAVRYAPSGLDDLNRARPGSLTKLPIKVEGAPSTLKLELSFDDGTSWRTIPAQRTATGWTATIPNPGTPGFASLRATVNGTSGTALTQTLIRAYAVGPA